MNTKRFTIVAYGPALCITLIPIMFLVFQTGSFFNMKIAIQEAKGSILTSFTLAVLSSLLISMVGFLSGYALERTKFGKNALVRSLFFFPFALPSVLLGIGAILMWNRAGLFYVYQSMFILSILWGAKYLPLAQRILADQIRQIPSQMEEVAFLTRLSWLKSLYRVVWPLARPGFLVAWGITYAFCLAELGGTLLVIPPGADTLPVRLYNIMHYGSSGLIAALGLVLIIMTIIPMALLVWYGKRKNAL